MINSKAKEDFSYIPYKYLMLSLKTLSNFKKLRWFYDNS